VERQENWRCCQCWEGAPDNRAAAASVTAPDKAQKGGNGGLSGEGCTLLCDSIISSLVTLPERILMFPKEAILIADLRGSSLLIAKAVTLLVL